MLRLVALVIILFIAKFTCILFIAAQTIDVSMLQSILCAAPVSFIVALPASYGVARQTSN